MSEPTAPAQARRAATAWAQEFDVSPDALTDLLQVLSELVAHAATVLGADIVIACELLHDGIFVSVTDADREVETLANPLDFSTRGPQTLRLVQLLARDWGIVRKADRKTVWATLER